jgi:retron-type reverse transcriptase
MLIVTGETRGRVLHRVHSNQRRLTWMSQKTLERLEYLRKANRNRRWTNQDLYRLMYKEDLYIIAYERIKSKPGNMTPGTDEETLDGFSLGTIRAIIQEMRTEQFSFKPVRQQFIPKPNGKMRKLGMPMVRSYCPPYQVLSGLRCERRVGSADPHSFYCTIFCSR